VKETTLEQFEQDVPALLEAAQRERILVTQNGKPWAVVVGIAYKDEEDFRLEASPEFWRMIQERRRQPTVPLAEVEKELLEDDLGPAMPCTLIYHGNSFDEHGMPTPWFHYLVIASPGPGGDTAIGSIVPLGSSVGEAVATQKVFATSGGPLAAISMAEEALDRRHPGLQKIISELKP
jgi:prevent-host-death family protein